MVDREAILTQTDIAALIERDLGPAQRHSGRWSFWRCPYHAQGQERTGSLGATPDNGKWKCFGCGASGNAIDWVMQRRGLSFLEACDELGGLDLSSDRSVSVSRDAATRNAPPPEPWQSKALELSYDAIETLWSERGARARAYLQARGLVDETIWTWQLGFVADAKRFEPLAEWGVDAPDDGKHHAMWIPRGITLPCFDERGEELLYLKVRRSPADISREYPAKYVKLRVPDGYSGSGLYGADHLRQKPVLFLEEGEINALTIWQEAGDLLDVASTGTSSVRPDTLAPFWSHLLMAQVVMTRFDPDASGRESGERWRALSRRIRCVQVPQGDDPNAFLAKHSGNVRAWIELELTRLGEDS